jgi:uncharacterized protein DUF3616
MSAVYAKPETAMDEQVILEFAPDLNDLGKGKELRLGLSAVARGGESLWLGNDEALSIERLSPMPGAGDAPRYGRQRSFALDTFFSLPDGGAKRGEADIESLAFADGFLWLVGSHSLVRQQPEPLDSAEASLRRLAQVERQPNRFLLARIPLAQEADGWTLQPSAEVDGERRHAARLPVREDGNALTRALAGDPHLAPFLALPGKDNGFDIEGIAVAGERVFLGLRGPVLRGWAVILELAPEDKQRDDEGERDPRDGRRLALRRIGPEGRRYRKHFLQLDGLGIRDLCVLGDDLLILAGPSMDVDGPVGVFRWRGGSRPARESLVCGPELVRLASLPTSREHAEGMALHARPGAPESLLLVYDAPLPTRLVGASGVLADLLVLPAP